MRISLPRHATRLFVAAALLAACSPPSTPRPDATADTLVADDSRAATDAATDDGTTSVDDVADASAADAQDASVDAPVVDAGVDATVVDAAVDAAADSAPDASDTGVDAPTLDAGVDAPTDAPSDATESGADASVPDVTADASVDASSDAPADGPRSISLVRITCAVAVVPRMTVEWAFPSPTTEILRGFLQLPSGTAYRTAAPDIAAGVVTATQSFTLASTTDFARDYRIELATASTGAVVATFDPVRCP
ncbi:MAG: hypothetical protein JNK05_36240 [Myxococcales bacterium]|nr:hypothetical protein [Myxococcales bacterium]